MASPKKSSQTTAANLGFEATLWAAADKLRNNMDAAEYKHVVLGLIFLKYLSDAFEELHAKLSNDPGSDPEDFDEYRGENVFWVPKESRWPYLQGKAKDPKIGVIIDDALTALEKANIDEKNHIPFSVEKNYARPNLDKERLGELIDLIGTIGLGDAENRSKDILGRVYEYFLSMFASAEGKNGGQFYTPQSVVRVLVAMLTPYKGRIFDPCCGSGGMFVQSEKFTEAHGGRIGDISIYGQESNLTTWKLAKMNLAIRGIDHDLGKEHARQFQKGSSFKPKSRFHPCEPALQYERLGWGEPSGRCQVEVWNPPIWKCKLCLDPAFYSSSCSFRNCGFCPCKRIYVLEPVWRRRNSEEYS
jgi:type I restriction enzyme M protein